MDDFEQRIRPWAITLVLHNWPIMVYSLLIPWAAVRAYLRPARSRILLLYGLLILAVTFEYQKHGLTPVHNTITYLFALNPAAREASYLVLLEWLPPAGHILGGALLVLSVVLSPRAVKASPTNGGHRLRTGR
jgi:hypothetical protein